MSSRGFSGRGVDRGRARGGDRGRERTGDHHREQSGDRGRERGGDRHRERSGDRRREQSGDRHRERGSVRRPEYDDDRHRDYSRDRGRDYSRNRGRDYSRDRGRDYSRDRGRDYSKDRGRDYGRDRGRDYGRDRGRGYGGRGARPTFIQVPKGKEYELIRKSNFGVVQTGRTIELLSNFYKLTILSKSVYHYDITIEKKGVANSAFLKKYSKDLIESFKKANNEIFEEVYCIYDGVKNLYTSKKLNLDNGYTDEILHCINENYKEIFIIKIQETKRNEIDLTPILDYYKNTSRDFKSELITILETLLNNLNEKQNLSFHRRKYFDLNNIDECDEHSFYQFVHGYTQAVYRTEFGLAMNLHLKTTIILSIEKIPPLIMLYCRKSADKLNNKDLIQVNHLLRHMKIFTTHGDKKINYVIEKIENITPDKKLMEIDGKKISIKEYFLNTYKITVNEKYPLIKTTGQNPKFLPLELCNLLKKQFFNKETINQFQDELLKRSTFLPEEYFTKVNQYASNIFKADERLSKEFGVTFNAEPVKLIGRILPQPLQLNNRRNDKFCRTPEKKIEWVMFSFDTEFNDKDMINLGLQMTSIAQKFGLQFNEKAKQYKSVLIKEHLDVLRVMKGILKCKPIVDIVFCIIPTTHFIPPSDIYYLIKACTERKKSESGGLMTQCMNIKNIRKLKSGYLENLLLKVNGKLGGANTLVDPKELQKLSVVTNKTMIIGIDVNHPNRDEISMSSIAAAVGSYDQEFSKYTASIHVQSKDSYEIIYKLDIMIEELINEYKKFNGYCPDNLIVFRDGVSEGQFRMIKNQELPLIQKAAKSKNSNTKIVLFVVQKRHHTRFYSIEGNNGPKQNSHNVPSGTVVDNSIVDPEYDSYYINSHFSPLGTSKPTKYVVLRNDLKLNAYKLKLLCFYMCFNAVQCRTVISIPTPIQYADRCAYRSKIHIEAQCKSEKINSSELEEIVHQLNEWVKIHPNIQNQLYYC